ncbi:MAG: hypothetical protein U0841_15170 [Chloroflexia bacterium]
MDTNALPDDHRAKKKKKKKKKTIMARCDELGAIGRPDRLTRRFATPALLRAMELVGGWCRDAGSTVSFDGRQPPRAVRGDGTDRRTLLLGSHLDSVRDAGKYDGPPAC